ncbi:rhodanese-like domain-containing protein [Candidatus Woesearchaeota archaeon]|nr:rhodanese-like domain-containing protein [Candidatus Woesearchaeota archaeon]
MEKIKFLAIEGLLEMIENKENFKLVEVLREDSYNEGHIPGAINIPADMLQGLASKHLDKNDTIVVYCSSYGCHASTNAAKTLLDLGYRKVLDFKAGKKGWADAGLELER